MSDNGSFDPPSFQVDMEPILEVLHRQLPTLTAEDVKKIQAEAGSYLDATEAFAAIAGCSREEWLRRVEAYKSKHPREKHGQPS